MNSVYGRKFDMDLQATDVFEEGHAMGKSELPITYFGPSVPAMGQLIAAAFGPSAVLVIVDEITEYPTVSVIVPVGTRPTIQDYAATVGDVFVEAIRQGGRRFLQSTVTAKTKDVATVETLHHDIAWLYPFNADTLVSNEWTARVHVDRDSVVIDVTYSSALEDDE